MHTNRKPKLDPENIATAWGFEAMRAMEQYEARGDKVGQHAEWMRARRLWAMIDRMRGVA